MAPFSMIKNKLLSQILCVVIYIISFYIAFILTPETIESIWLKILIWHLYATLFIYIGSVILNNSSLYDPFWSVAPVPIVIYLAVKSDNSIFNSWQTFKSKSPSILRLPPSIRFK